jgi:hypothetical protein
MTIITIAGVKRGLWVGSRRSPSNFGRFDPPLKKLMAVVPCRFSIQNSTAGKHVQMMNHGGACQQSHDFAAHASAIAFTIAALRAPSSSLRAGIEATYSGRPVSWPTD